MTSQSDQFRLLPSVDELLRTPIGQQLVERYSHTLVVQALRAVLAQFRAEIRNAASGQGQAVAPTEGGIWESIDPDGVNGLPRSAQGPHGSAQGPHGSAQGP